MPMRIGRSNCKPIVRRERYLNLRLRRSPILTVMGARVSCADETRHGIGCPHAEGIEIAPSLAYPGSSNWRDYSTTRRDTAE
ncbi:hypothetical protein [Cupriavidus sp. 8B]